MTTVVVDDAPATEAPGVAPLNLSEAGSWLCSRHPELRELVEQIGAWSADGPFMQTVRNALIEYDKQWAALPAQRMPRAGAVRELWVMSPSQRGRLRLLATLAPGTYEGPGLQFCVDDLATFDKAGKQLIADWLRCIRVGVIG